MKVRDYINTEFESAGYRTQQYVQFERLCKKELKKQIAERGINLQSFHGNHFEWSAVLERGGKFVYVSIGDVRFWDWYERVLVRTMAHEKDWHGGRNHFCSFDNVAEIAEELFEGVQL